MPLQRQAQVLRLPTAGPSDTTALAQALDRGLLRADEIVGIVGKTEGNGCVNDFTRGYATLALKVLLAERLACTMAAVEQRIALVMSGGTEGGLSPHLTVFCRRKAEARLPDAGKRLAIGIGFTRRFRPEEIGRAAQIRETAAAVRAAMAEAGIDDAADAHFVQIKCPLLTQERIAEAQALGADTATRDTYESMALSRGASALGVALALGEISAAQAADAAVGSDWSLFSGVASTSAGVELQRNEIIVLGNATGWTGDLRIEHDVMADAIDLEAARRALGRLGLAAAGQVPTEARARIVAVLAKAEAAPAGMIRGRRHIMLDDSDIHSTRHARALVGGVLAGLIGDTMLYVSGGAEHQGPAGGGPVAIIARVGSP
ncbi:ring-opening amidohydrolase [Vineibacter terrae]|uniref:cyanuric acid amidohydrolase n=1 Tax=Vineibacter terrae TaxID=2586908 RepID=UPI002E355DE8|nr:ring-opening amidohydrolase [Vineibacter terrae]HEX2891051.1 ring-opening amidohydrolase [Vineibacter terrae]